MKKLMPYCIGLLLSLQVAHLSAQQEIPWLSEYTDEMVIGKETFQYSFASVDGNMCKVEIRESVTGNKGDTEIRSWIFYLSDIDPDRISFNARGKSIRLNLPALNDQDFISYFEKNEFEEYTDGIELQMNEVDMTRAFIEALKEHMGPCRDNETTWENRDAVLGWLSGNIGEASEGDTNWEQEFSGTEKPHMALLRSKSVNSKGEEESIESLFDLSDIDPQSVRLEAKGRSLTVNVPVAEAKRYIRVTTREGTEYASEVTIFCDDIEVARQTAHALAYLVSATEPVRREWSDYNEALDFIDQQLGEVQIGDNLYQYDLQYDLFASDLLDLAVNETDKEGSTEEVSYAFYPADLTGEPQLGVTRREVTIGLESKEGNDYIRKSSGGSVTGYSSKMEIFASGIDEARDLIHALNYVIANSEEELESFENISDVSSWMEDKLVPLYRKDETYEQQLSVNEELRNQVLFARKLTEAGNEITETDYLFYPEDISLEEMRIQVRLGKLAVILETGAGNYIKYSKNGIQQNFTDDVDVYFNDPLEAKDFMTAIRFLKEKADSEEAGEMSRQEALSFLTGSVPSIEMPDEKYEQSLEPAEGENCKLKFTRVETGKDGKSNEFVYEFMVTDLSGSNSGMSVRGKLIEIELVTTGEKKLIKPYENGEVEDFTDEMIIYSDDVLLAKQLLRAFDVLSKKCQ